MTTPYISQQTVNDFGNRPASFQYSASVAASTDTSLTVPGKSPRWKAVIKVENLTWFALNATAAVPAGGTFASTTSEMILPGERICREVSADDVMHFISATAGTDVSVVLYAVGNNA